MAKVLADSPRFERQGPSGKYILGRSDFAEHPVYQTKWLKFGLRALGLPDPIVSGRIVSVCLPYLGADGRVVVVLVNLSKQELRCDLGWANEIDVYTTSSNSSLERSQQAGSAIAVPGRSVSTCIWGAR